MTAARRDYNSRGPGFRRAVGLFGAAAVCGLAAVIVILTSSASAQQQSRIVPRVVVTTVGGANIPVELEGRTDEDVDRTYPLRPGSQSIAVNGFSLRKVLQLSGDNQVSSFSYAQILRPGGNGTVLLSRSQVLAEPSAPNGPPAVYVQRNANDVATGLGFVRPSSGADDDNANDSFVNTDGVIYLALKSGKLLSVQASASPTRTKPGKAVRFRASVSQSGAGEQLTYSWFFQDGSAKAEGPSVTHKFREPGSYNVVVGVTTPNDQVGASDSVRIQVGKPAGGPDREGGGTDSDSPLDSGPSTGGTGLGPLTGAPPIPPSSTNPGQEQKAKPEPAAPLPSGEMVEGRVLASADGQPIDPAELPPASESDERAGARTGNPSDGGGGGIPGVAYGLLATMGMLGTGGLIELRGARSLRSW